MPVRLESRSSSNGHGLVSREHGQDAPETAQALDSAIELPSPYRLSGVTLAALAVVAGVVAIALGAWAFASSMRDGGSAEVTPTAPIYGAAQALSLLAKPSTQRIPLQGADGSITLAVGAGGRGLLVLDGLAVAPVGLTYQAWALDPAKRRPLHVPGATFTGIETIVPLTARVPPGWFVGITVERAGGVEAPTRPFRYGAQRPSG